jgi:hypothetical protein
MLVAPSLSSYESTIHFGIEPWGTIWAGTMLKGWNKANSLEHLQESSEN